MVEVPDTNVKVWLMDACCGGRDVFHVPLPLLVAVATVLPSKDTATRALGGAQPHSTAALGARCKTIKLSITFGSTSPVGGGGGGGGVGGGGGLQLTVKVTHPWALWQLGLSRMSPPKQPGVAQPAPGAHHCATLQVNFVAAQHAATHCAAVVMDGELMLAIFTWQVWVPKRVELQAGPCTCWWVPSSWAMLLLLAMAAGAASRPSKPSRHEVEENVNVAMTNLAGARVCVCRLRSDTELIRAERHTRGDVRRLVCTPSRSNWIS